MSDGLPKNVDTLDHGLAPDPGAVNPRACERRLNAPFTWRSPVRAGTGREGKNAQADRVIGRFREEGGTPEDPILENADWILTQYRHGIELERVP